MAQKKQRESAVMTPERRREIASRGGKGRQEEPDIPIDHLEERLHKEAEGPLVQKGADLVLESVPESGVGDLVDEGIDVSHVYLLNYPAWHSDEPRPAREL